jgi:hypothetical protein
MVRPSAKRRWTVVDATCRPTPPPLETGTYRPPLLGPASRVPLKDILAVKELVGRLGAGPLHTLIDAFAR